MNLYAEVLSFGAGVNSVALAIKALADGWRGEIVFCDTGCEWPGTYCYLDYFDEWLQSRYGLKVVRLAGLPWQRKSQGRSLIDYCEFAHVIPLAGIRWCTVGWKVEPMKRYCGERSQMLGIAADESRRKPDAIRPLVSAGITRNGCIEIIQGSGLDVPQKSGCYICPFMSPTQWRELFNVYPELFERVAVLEESAQRTRSGRIRATLDPKGRITLRDRERSYRAQIVLPELDMAGLLEFKPCVCNV